MNLLDLFYPKPRFLPPSVIRVEDEDDLKRAKRKASRQAYEMRNKEKRAAYRKANQERINARARRWTDRNRERLQPLWAEKARLYRAQRKKAKEKV